MSMTSRALSSRILTVSLILLLLPGCESMEGMFESAAEQAVVDTVRSSAPASGSGGSGQGDVDFLPGELLVLWDGNPPNDGNYLIAKALKAASDATNGEGEFLFVERGDVKWSPWFYETYIPDESELSLGLSVFYCNSGRAHFDALNQEKYRTSWWHVGRITSIDELFKDVVGIDGDPYQLASVRLPVEPIN